MYDVLKATLEERLRPLLERTQPMLADTVVACVVRRESKLLYIQGGKPHFPVPAIQYDVLMRPLGTAITRDWDGPDGNRFTFVRTWFKDKSLN